MKPIAKRPAARREFLLAASGLAAGIALESATASAATPPVAAKSTASAAATLDAIRKVAGSATINKGKVKLDLPELVDNGNAVPLTVKVDSPMTPTDYVRAIHIFTQKNPLPEVAAFRLGPRAGRAVVSTRVRLADTQTVIAIAETSDGSFWSGTADTVVTLAACLEEL
jgi:sulfur-oxidizing protein SoxY